MQTSIIDLNIAVEHKKLDVLHVALSFQPFIRFLEQKIKEEKTHKAVIYQLALDTFAAYPELKDAVSETDVYKYEPLLEQIYTILTPALASENDYLWALCSPMKPIIFYGTDAFYKLTCDTCNGKATLKPSMIIESADEEHIQKDLLHLYSIILEKLYGIPMSRNDMVYRTVDEHTGLLRYYQLEFDDRFIEVKANAPLPELSFETLQGQLSTSDFSDKIPLQALSKVLPLNMFSFEGFSVIALTDVTAEHSVDVLKDIAIEHHRHTGAESFATIELTLKSIVGDPDIRFGLQPLLRINNKLVFDRGSGFKSILLDLAHKYGVTEEMYQQFVEDYIKSPRLLFIRTITPLHKGLSPALKMLADNDIVSFLIAPLYYQGKLAGVLEAFSGKENCINEKMMSQLKSAAVILAQLVQQSVDDLQGNIARVITDKFTPLQPSVQWKFNEAAWEYLIKEQREKNPPLPPIVFEDVYPLYGAVDIRNSTEERNKALQTDLEVHVQILRDTMMALQPYKEKISIDEEVVKTCKEWVQKIEKKMSPYQAMKAEDFLHREIPNILKQVVAQHEEVMPIVSYYLQAIDENEGITFQQRRELEESMQLINRTVGRILDQFNEELQQQYPCYFEKFRTDGVEYDIYAGQSIAPLVSFHEDYLKKIRRRQLEVMALLTQQTKALLPQMTKTLQTTQLIFVHGSKIDISFRADEKRFDVQGSYNIRYQMAKKRIDKAYIKNTSQRLTQPGMIAIVYSGHSEIEDYLEGISQLQQAGILHPETEKVELEELQGLTGLKALRVKVLDGVVLQ